MGIKRMHTPDQRAALSVLELTDHEVGGYRCLTRHLLHEEWHAPQAGWWIPRPLAAKKKVVSIGIPSHV